MSSNEEQLVKTKAMIKGGFLGVRRLWCTRGGFALDLSKIEREVTPSMREIKKIQRRTHLRNICSLGGKSGS